MTPWRSVFVEGADGRLVERVDISRKSFKGVTAAQWQRLERLLVTGAVVELAWLQSATGVRRDVARQLMQTLVWSRAGSVTRLVFHYCADHPVAFDEYPGPGWRCPECEELIDGNDVRFEKRVTLTAVVRFVEEA